MYDNVFLGTITVTNVNNVPNSIIEEFYDRLESYKALECVYRDIEEVGGYLQEMSVGRVDLFSTSVYRKDHLDAINHIKEVATFLKRSTPFSHFKGGYNPHTRLPDGHDYKNKEVIRIMVESNPYAGGHVMDSIHSLFAEEEGENYFTGRKVWSPNITEGFGVPILHKYEDGFHYGVAKYDTDIIIYPPFTISNDKKLLTEMKYKLKKQIYEFLSSKGLDVFIPL